jgi:hypothetical protein
MWKSRHKGQQPVAVSGAEQVARYNHLVELLPAALTLKAHAAAFSGLSADQRMELLERLRPLVPEVQRAPTSEEADTLATIVGASEPRDTMMRTELAADVAYGFLHSTPVVAYFTDGVGSISIDAQPTWVSELARHESAPIDAGNANHQGKIDFKLTGW